MTLHKHWGHEELQAALARAAGQGTLPSALLIHGARGVGKQHLALWLSRLLLCESPGLEGPCDGCRSCHLAKKLEHPDLHWYFPLPRPKNANSPEKLDQALEEARGEALAERRKKPLWAMGDDGARSLYLAAARNLRKKAQRRPSMGPRQIFIIAEAEALAPQASGSEAANALLKLLEEPPEGTTLILTSGEPGRLLPTIRSRTSQIHLPPLTEEEVLEFLRVVAEVDEAEAHRAAGLSKGSIGRALGFLPVGDEPGPLARTRTEAVTLLSAALSTKPWRRIRAAIEFKPVGARGLGDLFDFLEECLGDLARAASGLPLPGCTEEEADFFRKAATRKGVHPSVVPDAVVRVHEARVMASGNVNPQLVVFGLLHDLRAEFGISGAGSDQGDAG